MKVLQIAPRIAPGSGVEAVAYHLEKAWQRAGVDVGRFTMQDAHGEWLPEPGGGLSGRLALAARVVWFSTVGTALARAAIARQPAGTVTVCHNDAVAGDVYVNHGNLRAAMRSRGAYTLRMIRNPLHIFTAARDTWRYRSEAHRVVVNLTRAERTALQLTYRRVCPRTVVIPNGVDTRLFVPPTPGERHAARARAGVPTGALHAVFVGHEFDRKGLPYLLRAAARLPGMHVSVIGGSADMLARLHLHLDALEIADRVHLAGRVPDPRPALHSADALVLPSAYEANALVVLEALACGVPVIATPVGYAPDVVVDGVTGFLTDRSAGGIHRALERLAALDDRARAQMRASARRTAEAHGWDAVAARYLDLFAALKKTAP